MATLRVAFLSALVLELSAALATALVAVEVGLRLLAGHLGYQTALLVLLLTPEAYLPLRAVGAQFHASMEGVAAAGARPATILDDRSSGRGPGPPRRPRPGRGRRRADLRRRSTIQLERRDRGLPRPRRARRWTGSSLAIAPGDRIVLTGPSGPARAPCWPCCCGSPSRPPGPIEVGRTVDLAGARPGRLAAADRLGAAAAAPVRRDRGQTTSRSASPDASRGGDRAGRRGWPGAAEFIEALPGGYDTRARRAGAAAVRGPAAADRAGPGVPPGRAAAAAGRADRAPGPGHRRRRSRTRSDDG